MLLAIETSSSQLGVALADAGRVVSSYELLADNPHAARLPEAVRYVLDVGGTTLQQVDAIAVDVGPGSFTGLRIGLAFAKALAFPRGLPLVAVCSLDLLATNVPWSPKVVCPILDAKQQNVYAALYRLEGPRAVRVTDPLLAKPGEVLQLLKEPAILLGDGCARYQALITELMGDRADIAPPDLWLPRAGALARLGQERFDAGQRDDPSRLTPLYLYRQDCGVNPAVSRRAPGEPRKTSQVS